MTSREAPNHKQVSHFIATAMVYQPLATSQVAWKGLEHRAQNLKQIFAARMLYFKVLDRRAS
jgi:hypothetical protein